MAERYTAILEWMGGAQGYGFFVEQDGQKVFVHYEPLPGQGFRVLNEGDKCAFEIIDGRRGPTADNIYQPEKAPPRHYDRF